MKEYRYRDHSFQIEDIRGMNPEGGARFRIDLPTPDHISVSTFLYIDNESNLYGYMTWGNEGVPHSLVTVENPENVLPNVCDYLLNLAEDGREATMAMEESLVALRLVESIIEELPDKD